MITKPKVPRCQRASTIVLHIHVKSLQKKKKIQRKRAPTPNNKKLLLLLSMHSRDPSPFTPAARATTLPTPSIIPPTTAKHHHHHRLHHPHHRHHHRGPSRAATQPQSGSGASGVSTADSDSLARVKTGEESGGGGGGGKDEKERKTWAVLRGKKVERGLGDKYDTRPFSFLLVFLKSLHQY